jgi:ferredoxin
MEVTVRSDRQVLRVDIIRCDGRGICAELAPDLVRLDAWGYPMVRPGPVLPELTAQARWAVTNCPMMALRLERATAADRVA